MPVNAMKGPTMTVSMEPSPAVVRIIPPPPILSKWIRFKNFLSRLWLEAHDWFDI